MTQWTPKIDIPLSFLNYANNIKIPERYQDDINEFKYGFIATSSIPWHTDKHCDPYSFLFVIRNEGNYKVQQWGYG